MLCETCPMWEHVCPPHATRIRVASGEQPKTDHGRCIARGGFRGRHQEACKWGLRITQEQAPRSVPLPDYLL